MAKLNETPDEDIEFVDAENYVPEQKGSMTYEQIVLNQINRCVTEGSKEMVGGYFKEKVARTGQSIEIYVPDQRQVYIQSINSLYDLLLPYFDEEMNNYVKIFTNQLLYIKQSKLELLKEKMNYTDDNRIKYQIQLQISSGYLDIDSVEAKQAMDVKLELYRFLYQQLLLLFSRQNHLMVEAIMA